jgi:hypothetical protein
MNNLVEKASSELLEYQWCLIEEYIVKNGIFAKLPYNGAWLL